MTSLAQLAYLLRDLETQLLTCMRCGFCQAVCPIHAQTGHEADVARGKLALLLGLRQELVRDPAGVKETLERCLLCGSCAAACPSGVKVLEIFITARAILAGYLGLDRLKRLILRGVLTRPRLFDLLLSVAAAFQPLAARPVNDLLGTSCGRLLPALKERHFRGLAATPFHRLKPKPGTAGSGPRAAFFVGCLVDRLFPQVGLAVVRALAHHRIDLVIPDGQACCGIPALSAGDLSAFRQMLDQNLQVFAAAGCDCLLTACATCAATIKKFWPLLDPRPEVARLAGQVRDVSQFLVEQGLVAEANPAQEAQAVTYHDPCHLKKSLGVAAEPRRLLRANPRVRLVEMAEADVCCGLGGSFNLSHYGLSSAIGRRKLDNVLASGAGVVATGCPACLVQLSEVLSKSGAKVAVKHAVEVYAEGLG
jgi:glycolate oxidase iron-sulfur subunit